MVSSKYNSIWPLPGPVDDFVATLKKVLEYVKRETPNDETLANWFLSNYPNVTKIGIARQYTRSALMHSGLVVYKGNKLSLSQDGLKYHEKPNNNLLFHILNSNVIGFAESVRILGEFSMDLNKFHKALTSELGVSWTHAYGQPYFRVCWLRSMDFVKLVGHNYTLTPNGKTLLESIGKLAPEKLAEIEQKSEAHEEIPTNSITLTVKQDNGIPLEHKTEIEQICIRLKEVEHRSSEFKLFEEEIGKAFKVLGFDTKVLGQPGQTDVLIEAPIGAHKYSVVVDAKTTSSDKIIENQINWDSITDHRRDNETNFAAIIGPSFAGGDLIRRALNHDVVLIETDTLVDLLKIHSDTPLTLLDLKTIFLQKGLLRLEDCKELHENSDSYSSRDAIMSKVLSVLINLQREPERTTLEYIRSELGRKEYTEQELFEVLELLTKFGVINKELDNSYTVIARPDIVAEKFITLASSILNDPKNLR